MKRTILIIFLMAFVFHANAYHWTPISGPYANTATLIGVIQIDGVEQTLTTLEVGAFCGDECRGREIPMYVSQLNRYLLFMTLYGNDGDEIAFRLYDHTLNQELELTCASTVTFVTNATFGSPASPYVLNFEGNATTYTISATANPSDGGSVSGSGTYNFGQTCTLTATPNEGFVFVNWTKDGTIVSTNPTYSFTVTEDASYVANFEGLPGDANGDGTMNALDIVIIVNYILGETPEDFFFDNADVNGDGAVNALDIVAIINLIFSKES